MFNEMLAELPPEFWVDVLDHCRPTPAVLEAGVTLLAQTAILVGEQRSFFALRQVLRAAAHLRPLSLDPTASDLCHCIAAGVQALQPSFP